MQLAEGFMQSLLKQSDPEHQLNREVLTKHIDAQHKLAGVQLSEAIIKVAEKVQVLSQSDKPNVAAITALERIMAKMAD